MESLDLHGIQHHRAELIVENFILLHEPPLKIVTGNSPKMHSLATQVVERHGLSWDYESYYNLGAIVVIGS